MTVQEELLSVRRWMAEQRDFQERWNGQHSPDEQMEQPGGAVTVSYAAMEAVFSTLSIAAANQHAVRTWVVERFGSRAAEPLQASERDLRRLVHSVMEDGE